jgi:poly-gamma-glutamate synthesis protein (capsule biosynthesis protein)
MKWRVISAITVMSVLVGLISMNAQKKDHQVVIGLAGDTMIGRLVNEVIAKKGAAYPWGPQLLHLLQKTDLNLVNLETTLTTSTHAVPKVFNFKSDPQNVKTLEIAHIHAVNLANNHMLDFGNKGLVETIQTLDAAHIAHVGAGIDYSSAKKPAIFDINGIKIGIIGYADYPEEWAATKHDPGINYIHVGDTEPIEKDILKLRQESVDLIILSLHWGPNMRQHPTLEFITFAHNLIDAGIDIIHGHSAHIFQGMERYNNGLILYDTGDFIDDYAIDSDLRNDQGIFFQVTVTKGGNRTRITDIKFIPLIIDAMRVEIATGNQAKEILNKMTLLTNELKQSKT